MCSPKVPKTEIAPSPPPPTEVATNLKDPNSNTASRKLASSRRGRNSLRIPLTVNTGGGSSGANIQ